MTWVTVDGVHEVEVLEKLGSCFGLHLLVMEDILNTDQRPKIEDYGEDLFVVLKMLSYDDRTGEISAEQVSLVLRSNAVLYGFHRHVYADYFLEEEMAVKNKRVKGSRVQGFYIFSLDPWNPWPLEPH